MARIVTYYYEGGAHSYFNLLEKRLSNLHRSNPASISKTFSSDHIRARKSHFRWTKEKHAAFLEAIERFGKESQFICILILLEFSSFFSFHILVLAINSRLCPHSLSLSSLSLY
jgi:hypothetical protein